jgi:hypothetical protein
MSEKNATDTVVVENGAVGNTAAVKQLNNGPCP